MAKFSNTFIDILLQIQWWIYVIQEEDLYASIFPTAVTHSILRKCQLSVENLTSLCCYKMIAIDSESFCCCKWNYLFLISLPWKYASTSIAWSHFPVRCWLGLFMIFLLCLMATSGWAHNVHNLIFLLNWNKVSFQQMQYKRTVNMLIFSGIWLFLRKCFTNLSAVLISVAISCNYPIFSQTALAYTDWILSSTFSRVFGRYKLSAQSSLTQCTLQVICLGDR